ncbi:MAG: redoxin domain-containing protein, partial [Bacteroidota bacterium]
MKIINLLLILLLFISFSFAQDNTFILKGWTKDVSDGTILYLNDDTGTCVDSFVIKDNRFQVEGKVTNPFAECFIILMDKEAPQACMFFAEAGKMTFDARTRDFENAKITGSKLQAQKDELFALTYPIMKQQTPLYEKLNATTKEEERKNIRAQIQVLQQKDTEITKAFILAHPTYYVSVRMLYFLKNRHLPKAEIQVLYDAVSEEMKATEAGQSIKVFLEQSVELGIGDKAPDFELPNLAEEAVKLSDFKGKYVLLEFGSSGCGPCRMENPNLLKAYQKYQEKGFEILSVWLDN